MHWLIVLVFKGLLINQIIMNANILKRFLKIFEERCLESRNYDAKALLNDDVYKAA